MLDIMSLSIHCCFWKKSIINIIDVFLLHFGCFLFKLLSGQLFDPRRHNLFQTRPKCGRTEKKPPFASAGGWQNKSVGQICHAMSFEVVVNLQSLR